MIKNSALSLLLWVLCSVSALAGPDFAAITRILKSPLGSRILATTEFKTILGEVAANGELDAFLLELQTARRAQLASELGERLLRLEQDMISTKANSKVLNLWVAERFSARTLSLAKADFLSAAGPVQNVKFDFPGMQVASAEDATRSTGATLFYFPNGAYAAYDARGGSVASSETHLLDAGSYSNQIDALVFAGGSTMGLEAASGVRRGIFSARKELAGNFEHIPSVPAAVVYDFGGRVHPEASPLIYPTADLGESLLGQLSDTFKMGRAGAGLNTTANKISVGDGTIWGGQGAAFKSFRWGRVFAAVIMNPVGDVYLGGRSMGRAFAKGANLPHPPVSPGQNTTLSVIITDLPLNRNQLQRLSVQVHTNMAETIRPFHTYHDGDINFAVSVPNLRPADPRPEISPDVEFELATEATALMKRAMSGSVKVANSAR